MSDTESNASHDSDNDQEQDQQNNDSISTQAVLDKAKAKNENTKEINWCPDKAHGPRNPTHDLIAQWTVWKKTNCPNDTTWQNWCSTINPNNIRSKLPPFTAENIRNFCSPSEQIFLYDWGLITKQHKPTKPKDLAMIHQLEWDDELEEVRDISETIMLQKPEINDTMQFKSKQVEEDRNEEIEKEKAEKEKNAATKILLENVHKILIDFKAKHAEQAEQLELSTKQTQKLAEQFTAITLLKLRNIKQKPFMGKFPSDNKMIYQYILELRQHIITNGCHLEREKFYAALSTAPEQFQYKYIDTLDGKEENKTLQHWVDYVCKIYKPPKLRMDMMKKLKSLVPPKNINPKVWLMFIQTRMLKFNECMHLYNKYRTNGNPEILPKALKTLSLDEKQQILYATFHENVGPKWDNYSYTNKKMVEKIRKANLAEKEYEEWVKFIEKLPDILIPAMDTEHSFTDFCPSAGQRNVLILKNYKSPQKRPAKSDNEGPTQKKHKSNNYDSPKRTRPW